MPTLLTLFQAVSRKLTPAEVDTNFINLRTTADAAAAALGGFTASQTPGANQMPVTKGNSTMQLPGSVGIGGPVSSWAGNFTGQVLEFKDGGSLHGLNGAADWVGLSSNIFYDGAYKRKGTGFATWYRQSSGEHIWSNAVSGAAGSTITHVELMKLDSSGNLLAGVGSGTSHILKKSSAVAGVKILDVGGVNNICASFYEGNTAAPNAAAACQTLYAIATSGRSLSVGGTVNTGGADYAEYERKNRDCATVQKGQIIGFDVNGHITDRWAAAVSFGVKSTSPSFVGGDTWGGVVGNRPAEPVRVMPVVEEDVVLIPGDTDDEWATKQGAHVAAKADFEARLEMERQTVDRIAYSGKVPCNVTGATVGDYIIAVQDGDGIGGLVVAEPDFSQYRRAVGRVRRILADGRPEIAIIVH